MFASGEKAFRKIQQYIPGTVEHALQVARRQVSAGKKVVLDCIITTTYKGFEHDFGITHYDYTLQINGRIIEERPNGIVSISMRRSLRGRQGLGKEPREDNFIFTGVDEEKEGVRVRLDKVNERLLLLQQSLPGNAFTYTLKGFNKRGDVIPASSSERQSNFR